MTCFASGTVHPLQGHPQRPCVLMQVLTQLQKLSLQVLRQRQTLSIFMFVLASMHKNTEDALAHHVLMPGMSRGMRV